MGEVKFRGKRIDTGAWVFGSYLYQYFSYKNQKLIDAIAYTVENQTFRPQVDPETVGQFTGLKDKNGVDIYEGDILAPIIVGKKNRYIVRWYKEGACFHIRHVDQDEGGYSLYVNNSGYSPYEVVGNIHSGTAND